MSVKVRVLSSNLPLLHTPSPPTLIFAAQKRRPFAAALRSAGPIPSTAAPAKEEQRATSKANNAARARDETEPVPRGSARSMQTTRSNAHIPLQYSLGRRRCWKQALNRQHLPAALYALF